MDSFSISFTLGKASEPHGANVEHNNREFIAKNINENKTHENVTYVRQEVKEAYNQLFGKSLEEYNQKQKQPCRRIKDYYEHISGGKREEAFYEIVVQFGDKDTAPCGSENGKITQSMLDEYIRGFRKRNPNLYIFNAVLHMDEASPHLHINFIPFYTQGRKNGLSKGVSMKAALDEQGFTAKNFKENRLVEWEESERNEMERILNSRGFKRENKNAHYAHQSVDEFKKSQDEKKMVKALRTSQQITKEDLQAEHVNQLRTRLNLLEKENKKLEKQKQSPYKSFYYSAPDKQAFVQSKLEEFGIPYRETENGFEAQECFVDEIRKLEKEFKPQKSIAREKLRDEIDRLLMQSNSIDELLEKLKKEKYIIKQGKYISVKPHNSGQFIRIKSLGEFYSEYALRNRINAKKKYENEIQQKINSAKNKDNPQVIVLKTIQFYTIAFTNGALPMKKRETKKPFSWNNDKELDKLTALNRKINNGATLESLKREFENQEKIVAEKEAEIKKAESDLKAFYELKEKIEIVFEGKKSDLFTEQQAKLTLQKHLGITKSNYKNIDMLIKNETENLKKSATELSKERDKLKETVDMFSTAEKVMGGTYVQTLVGKERERMESKYVPNGLKSAN